MLRIAIVTPPQAGQRWTLMRQCGVECAVGGINLRPKPGARAGGTAVGLYVIGKGKGRIRGGRHSPRGH